jgi:hypothetical protein
MAESQSISGTLEEAFSTLALTGESPSEESHSPQAYNPFRVFLDAQQEVNELERLVRDQLRPGLESQQTIRRISPDDPFFQHAWDIWRRENWDGEGLSNYIKLICGVLAFPVIVLLNPSNFDQLLFDEMVRNSPTLRWLKDMLESLSLTLEDIIVIDCFSLLTDEKMDDMEDDEKVRMANEVFTLTVEFLRQFQPQIIISCQCATKPSHPRWGIVNHPLAQRLCSSVYGARNHNVVEVSLDERTIHVVQGFHPMHIERCDNLAQKSDRDQVLRQLLEALYRPCADWKDQRRREYEERMTVAAAKSEVAMVDFLSAITDYHRHQRQAIEFGTNSTQLVGLSNLVQFKSNVRWVASILPNI